MICRALIMSAIGGAAFQLAALELITTAGRENEMHALLTLGSLGSAASALTSGPPARRELQSSVGGGWVPGSGWDLTTPGDNTCQADNTCAATVVLGPPHDGGDNVEWGGCPANSVPPTSSYGVDNVCLRTEGLNEGAANMGGCLIGNADCCGFRGDVACPPGYDFSEGDVCWSTKKEYKYSVCCVPVATFAQDFTQAYNPTYDDGNETWTVDGLVISTVDQSIPGYSLSNATFSTECIDDWGDGIGWVFIFIQVFFSLGWLIPAGIAICICRNKSMNTAPFNGQPVPSYPQTATAQAVAMPMSTVQMQCPDGASPGSMVTADINGVQMNITVPQGIKPGDMFSVQVPVTPSAPVDGLTMNPLGNGGVGSGSVIDQMSGLRIEQVINVAELMTGCEMRNKYEGKQWSASNEDQIGPVQLYFEEANAAGCERIMCKQNRHLQMNVHEGHDNQGNVIMQIHKSFGVAELCCARPSVMIFDGQGNKIGNVEDPYKCCVMDQRIFDPDGTQIYGTAGSVCQIGICCPCMGSVEFDITDTNGEPNDGKISKVFGGCGEMMAKINKFNVAFPAGATAQQKMALLGTAILIDFEYFEKK